MTTTLPTRAAIDRAGDLDFDRRPARQELTITVKARFNGFDTEITFSGQLDQLDAITKRIVQLGGEPVSTPAPAGKDTPRKPATRVTPAYSEDGQPICPKHKKPLKEGNWGLYCPAKDDSTERGYCSLKFSE